MCLIPPFQRERGSASRDVPRDTNPAEEGTEIPQQIPAPSRVNPRCHRAGIRDCRDPRDAGISRIPAGAGQGGIRERPCGDPGMPPTGITPLSTGAGPGARECGAGHIPGAPSLRKELFENPDPGGERRTWDVELSWESRPPSAPEAPPGHPRALPGQQRLLLGHFSGSARSPSRARCRGAFPAPGVGILCRRFLAPNTNRGSRSR